MFLIIETSPGNHQAWLALPGEHDREFARRVRRGVGADFTASGATKIAGSLNFKDKYAPDFPRVTIREAQPGRMTSPAELERMGLVAPLENFAPLSPARPLFARHRQMAELCPVPRQGAAQPRRQRARPQPGRLRVVHDRDFVGPRHRRNRRASCCRKAARRARKARATRCRPPARPRPLSTAGDRGSRSMIEQPRARLTDRRYSDRGTRVHTDHPTTP